MPDSMDNAIEAFGIVRGSIVAVVGAGGKKTLAHRIAKDARARGWRVVTTVTAKTRAPRDIPTVVEPDDEKRLSETRRHLDATRIVFAAKDPVSAGKVGGVSPEWVAAIAKMADVVVVKADGAKARAIKAHGPHEPVIPPSATHVIACVSAKAIDAPLSDEVCSRVEEFTALTGVRPGDPITRDAVARLFSHSDGMRKNVPPGARFIPFVTHSAPSGLLPDAVYCATPDGRFER